MRGVAIVVMLVLAEQAWSQPTAGTRGRGQFGAAVVKGTQLRGQSAVMFGGRGGWTITPSLVLGFGLYGTTTAVDAREGAVPDAPGALDVKLESFGLEVEYHVEGHLPTHLTLGAFVGGAAARYVRDGTNEQHGETDFMLLLEPSAGVERRIVDCLHLHLAASWRLASGVEQPGLAAGDVVGPAVALAAKIGRF